MKKDDITTWASKEEAIQYLADYTGSKIIIAAPVLSKLLSKLSKKHNIEESVILELAEGDPTYKGNPKTDQSKTINTVIPYYKEDKNVDLKKVSEAIKEFSKLKGSGKIKQDTKLPESFKDLEKAIKGDNNDLVLHSDDKFEGMQKIGTDGQYRLFLIDEKDEWNESCAFVKGKTNHPWCVKEEDWFNKYKQNGFYLFTKGNDFYALLSDRNNEFHSVKQGQPPVSLEEFEPIKELAIKNNLKEMILESDAEEVKWSFLSKEEIVSDPELSYEYAKDVLEGRFKEGEKAIATSPHIALVYALNILEGARFPEGEKIIATSPGEAYAYARYVLKGERFKEGEKAIATSPHIALVYAREILKGERVPEIEKGIATNPKSAYWYALGVLEGKRVPEIEKGIVTNSMWAYLYAKNVLKGRFKEGEKAIASDPEDAKDYADKYNLNYDKESKTFTEKEPVTAFDNTSEAIQYLADYTGSKIIIAGYEDDTAYFEALKDHYKDEPDLIEFIKQGESNAKQGFGSDIKTEVSDSGNIIVRYIEQGNNIGILGMISKKGKLVKSDVSSLKSWMKRLLDKIRNGYQVLASTNKFSKPIFEKIIKMAKEEGIELNEFDHGNFVFGNHKWENMIIVKK